ncbi:MAG: CDP-diacylglycerol--glycerol-3-phosphate 3-phosphatidyltransferase [Verrucomicrobiota bacterium]|jgi:CDP-diacylglycerol--glycerol-3-phosphate 3-phosphatidyltransferase|nr:CDP-diacylglycerol--glycerol-3-phosphate 3-phosphatidyltransferase [Verrucomicrobiota bacterium]MEE2614774.1 CDP-diacylglycerol--glycerol-3-phosphate 3-phosphatidyltransferase [Verrucomicrobiota bacterium]
MNLPNKLTISRIIMTVFFLFALIVDFPFHYTLALVLFVIASITDFLDGSLARKRGLITDFGKLMDPLADKILICSAFIGFIELGWMKAWMVVIIVSRELAITGLRLLAASKNQVLAAERQGKNKTITQITAIISLLIYNSYTDWGVVGKIFGFEIAGHSWSWWVATISIWAAVVLTAYSGILYLWKNREVYLKDC